MLVLTDFLLLASQSRTRIGTTGGETSFVITQRTAKMHKFLGAKFETQDPLSFETLFAGKSKRTVAIGFFEILNIKSKNCIDLHQSKAYADITLKKHPVRPLACLYTCCFPVPSSVQSISFCKRFLFVMDLWTDLCF